MEINLNDNVWVKISSTGKQILEQQHNVLEAQILAINPDYQKRPQTLPKEDADGWSKWQLWHLFDYFGSHISLGVNPLPFGTTIRFEPEDTKKESNK